MAILKTGNQKRPNILSQKQEQLQARDLAAVPHKPLRLKAKDQVDLKVMSALLQDAIVPGTNFSYDAKDKTFTILANRFCWEESPERLNHKKVYGRILCCFQFQYVEKVQHIDIDQKSPENYYNLLNVDYEETSAGGEILMTFSGTSRFKLKVSDLSCHITDLEDMWYSTNITEHKDKVA